MEHGGVVLRTMRKDEFEFWQALSKADCTRDLMLSFGCGNEMTEQKYSRVQMQLLPLGFNTPDNYFRIIELQDQAQGYLWFSLIDGAAFLMALILLPSCQGRGLGQQAMRLLIDELQILGACELELRVAPNNLPAIRLYDRCGFRITGLNMHINLNVDS